MVKDKEDKEMYLNKDLVYKVTDEDGKEIGCPYFKSKTNLELFQLVRPQAVNK